LPLITSEVEGIEDAASVRAATVGAAQAAALAAAVGAAAAAATVAAASTSTKNVLSPEFAESFVP